MLLATATAEEVTVWLTSHRFANYLHTFQDFSGNTFLFLRILASPVIIERLLSLILTCLTLINSLCLAAAAASS